MSPVRWVLLAGLWAAACSGRTEVTVPASGGAAGAAGQAGQAGQAGAGGAPVACPKGRGPEMVAVQFPAGWFCIDSTEVSEHQYADFLDHDPPLDGQPANCTWNDSYTNIHEWGSDKIPRSKLPRRKVDWCDARAYCEWAGKRLCGRPGGGPAPFDAFASPSASEWYFACSRGGERAYPYGMAFEENACVTAEYAGPKEPNYVGATSQCRGGFAGLFDMSGNVAEWEDSCNVSGGSAECRVRGGGESAPAELARCQTDQVLPEDATESYVGIRCCADATPTQ